MSHKYQVSIFIVDDHQIFLEGLKNTLLKYDWLRISGTANNAEDAIQMIKTTQPDLIITDISMPGMSGLEMVESIREFDSGVKIVFLSMFELPVINHAVQGYLKKDTTEEELVGALKKIGLDNERYFQGDSEDRRDHFIKDHFLTKRERQIIECLSKDLSGQQIAEELSISYHTVVVHKKNIFLKLNVKSSAAAVSEAFRLGVIQM